MGTVGSGFKLKEFSSSDPGAIGCAYRLANFSIDAKATCIDEVSNSAAGMWFSGW